MGEAEEVFARPELIRLSGLYSLPAEDAPQELLQ
jgi:hypothetical protein